MQDHVPHQLSMIDISQHVFILWCYESWGMCAIAPAPALYIDKGTEKQQDETVCFNIETAGKLEIGFVPCP